MAIEVTVPIRKKMLLKTKVLVLDLAPRLPLYPATKPMVAKLQAQEKTLSIPNKNTATKTLIPECSECKIPLIQVSITFYFFRHSWHWDQSNMALQWNHLFQPFLCRWFCKLLGFYNCHM